MPFPVVCSRSKSNSGTRARSQFLALREATELPLQWFCDSCLRFGRQDAVRRTRVDGRGGGAESRVDGVDAREEVVERLQDLISANVRSSCMSGAAKKRIVYAEGSQHVVRLHELARLADAIHIHGRHVVVGFSLLAQGPSLRFSACGHFACYASRKLELLVSLTPGKQTHARTLRKAWREPQPSGLLRAR